MIRHTLPFTLAAGLLAACGDVEREQAFYGDDAAEDFPLTDAEDEEGDEGAEGRGPGAFDDELKNVDPVDHDPTDDLTTPDPDGGPAGRITYLGDENGDLIVHAKLSDEVAELYPAGDHYELRFDLDGAATYATIVDAQGAVVELVRVAERAPFMGGGESEAVQFCFPFPFLPPIVNNCYAPPCPWENEPGDFGWPNCFEAGMNAEGQLEIVGDVDGTQFGRGVNAEGQVTELFSNPLPEVQAARIERVAVVSADVLGLQAELEPLDLDCLECLLAGLWIANKTSECLNGDFDACWEAYEGHGAWEQNCQDKCG